MARMARVVIPGIPHHITQRGNRRQPVFFCDQDYRYYKTLRRYTRYINFREGWKGYLWQGSFSSFPMDDYHLYSAARYIELNPLPAGLCNTAESWQWSSA